MLDLLKKMMVVRLLVDVIQAATKPLPLGDLEGARKWVLGLLKAGAPLTDETGTPIDDATVDLMITLVESEAWDACYEYVTFVLDNLGSLCGAEEDDDAALVCGGRYRLTRREREGARLFRRFGLRESRVLAACEQLCEEIGVEAYEALPDDERLAAVGVKLASEYPFLDWLRDGGFELIMEWVAKIIAMFMVV